MDEQHKRTDPEGLDEISFQGNGQKVLFTVISVALCLRGLGANLRQGDKRLVPYQSNKLSILLC